MSASYKSKPDRADICIIGTGAAGATAAKVLTEAGIKVVALERGPWMQSKDFGGDELANVNRAYLTPDLILSPRMRRSSPDEDAEMQAFVPYPQMVGGTPNHWAGWLLRMIASDFVPHTMWGDIPGASLADWPITYWDMEPYYDKVEWALGVSGQAGANKYEAPRNRDYPLPPIPPTRYAQKFHEGCARLGYNSFPTPMAMLSRPYNGRPRTIQSAFVQQHGDPSGTKSTMLTTFIPDALKTGRYEIRPNCYVREITVDGQGQATGAVYQAGDGAFVEQEADVFLLACGAIETARLLLLSQSSRFPHGLANGSGLVGKNLTLHEYTAAVGAFDDELIYGWAGGGYVSASTFEFYQSDYRRGFIGGCHVAAAGVGIPLPINFQVPGRPLWGPEAKELDRKYFNRSMAVGLVIHDLPQETNRVELDPTEKDAWGVPVPLITQRPHPNDLAQGRWIVDRNAEILEAAGASKVWKVYAETFSGNSHQHSTTRMGNDPSKSVVNKWCQSHEVNNLYCIDSSSFPTATGVNPTLTIMANAWRVAEHLTQERGRAA